MAPAQLRVRMRKILMITIMGLATASLAVQPSRAQSAHFFSTLKQVHVTGFQGWFACPSDPTNVGWGHWFRGGAGPQQADSLAVDV